MSRRSRPRPVTVEDYESDGGSPERITTGRFPTAANVRPSESVGSDPTNGGGSGGGGPASDSGYSSHAAATAASLDSNSNNSTVKPTEVRTSDLAYDAPEISPTTRLPRPYRYAYSAPARPKEQPGQRDRPTDARLGTTSDSRGNRHQLSSAASRPCDCRDCRLQSSSHRDRTTSSQATRNPTPTTFGPRPTIYDESYYFNAPAPAATSRYTTDDLMTSTAAGSARPRSSTPRSRPMSYHAGVPVPMSSAQDAMYYNQIYDPAFYVPDHGPPPSSSAYTNAHWNTATPVPHSAPLPTYGSYPMAYGYPVEAYPYPYDPSRSATPVNTIPAYPMPENSTPGPAMPAPAPFMNQRRSSSRPTSMYGAPIIDYDHMAISDPSAATNSTKSRRSSTYGSGDYDSYQREQQARDYRTTQDTRDAQTMPPPSRPSRRASVGTSRTTNSSGDMPRSMDVPRPSEAGATVTVEAPYRSHRRESSYHRQSSSRRPTASSEPSSQQRSTKSFEPPERRSSRDYYDSSRSYSDRVRSHSNFSTEVPEESGNRQPKSSWGPLHRPDKLRAQERSAEQYQKVAAGRVTASKPLTDDALDRQQRRLRRDGTGNSSGSHSRASDSHNVGDPAPRSASGQTIHVPDTEGGFTMRFTPGADVELDFPGGLKRRTISLKPGQTGQQAELSIRSATIYPEDRSSGKRSEYAKTQREKPTEDGERASHRERGSDRTRRTSRAPRLPRDAY